MRRFVLDISLLCAFLGATPTLASAQRSETYPGLARVRWDLANGIVYADTMFGVQLWVAPNEKAEQGSLEFVGGFDPAAIQRWSGLSGALLTADRTAWPDSVRELVATLLTLDSAALTVVRERPNGRWNDDLTAYFLAPPSAPDAPREQRSFSLRTSMSGLLELGNALLVASEMSRWIPPHERAGPTAKLVIDNPLDSSQCARQLEGNRWVRYPEQLREAGIEGVVWASYVIAPSGRADPASLRPLFSDNRSFTYAVAAAIGRFRYEPARRGGLPVASRVHQRFTFLLTR